MRNPYLPHRRGFISRRARHRMFHTIYHALEVNMCLKSLCVLMLVGPPVAILLVGFFGGHLWRTVDEVPSYFLYLDTNNDTLGANTWIAEGWDYHHTLDSILSTYLVTGEDLMHGRVIGDDPETGDGGYWVSGNKMEKGISLGYWTVGQGNGTRDDLGTQAEKNSPEKLNIQVKSPANKLGRQDEPLPSLNVWGIQRNPRAMKISLGLSLYMEGNSELKLTYFDKDGIRIRNKPGFKGATILGNLFYNGLCNFIVDVPEADNIEKVQIQAHLGKGKQKSIVIIDKVIVTMGETKDQSLVAMYSMVPDNWCKHKTPIKRKIII